MVAWGDAQVPTYPRQPKTHKNREIEDGENSEGTMGVTARTELTTEGSEEVIDPEQWLVLEGRTEYVLRRRLDALAETRSQLSPPMVRSGALHSSTIHAKTDAIIVQQSSPNLHENTS